MRLRLLFVLLPAVLLLATGCRQVEETAEDTADAIDDDTEDALVVDVNDTSAPGEVTGQVRFMQEGDRVRASGRVEGLSPGMHGFHIHENGSCDATDTDGDGEVEPAAAAGGHYAPDGSPHGAPDDPPDERHAGDFGNISADDNGVAEVDLSYPRPETNAMDEFEGLTLMIHQGEDDLTSQPSGAAGARVGCGVLQEASGESDMDM